MSLDWAQPDLKHRKESLTEIDIKNCYPFLVMTFFSIQIGICDLRPIGALQIVFVA